MEQMLLPHSSIYMTTSLLQFSFPLLLPPATFSPCCCVLSQSCLGQFCSHPSWFLCSESIFISPSRQWTSLPDLLVTALKGQTHSWCRITLRIHPWNRAPWGHRRGSSVWNSCFAVCVKFCTGFVIAMANMPKAVEDNRSFFLMLQAGHMDSSHSQPMDVGFCQWLETSGFLTLVPSHWLSPFTRAVCCYHGFSPGNNSIFRAGQTQSEQQGSNRRKRKKE